MTWRPWAQAWQAALYGDAEQEGASHDDAGHDEGSAGAAGFYRGAGPAAHFATSAQGAPGVGAVFAEAVVALVRKESLSGVVDVGAGRGELLAAVHELAPDLTLLGVDVCPRPDLAPGIGWLPSPGGELLPDELGGLRGVLVIANEWLDVVPCTVAQADEQGVLRAVLVDTTTGDERLGEPLAGAELRWCQDVGGSPRPGDRLEVGLSRERAWADLLRRLDDGVAVAVDYGYRRAGAPAGGTLTGYRSGGQVPPVPDGSCDLTAHVAMEDLDHDELLIQREALRRLGVQGALPPHSLASSVPAAYLRGLARAGAEAALIDPAGLGGFWWVVARRP